MSETKDYELVDKIICTDILKELYFIKSDNIFKIKEESNVGQEIVGYKKDNLLTKIFKMIKTIFKR